MGHGDEKIIELEHSRYCNCPDCSNVESSIIKILLDYLTNVIKKRYTCIRLGLLNYGNKKNNKQQNHNIEGRLF